jgi:hypothetical protein
MSCGAPLGFNRKRRYLLAGVGAPFLFLMIMAGILQEWAWSACGAVLYLAMARFDSVALVEEGVASVGPNKG